MNIFDIITREEFAGLKRKAENRIEFQHSRTIKVSDGKISIRIYGRTIESIYRSTWNGEGFLCGYQIGCYRKNNFGGMGVPITRKEFLNYSYEEFVEFIERDKSFPDDYTKFKNVSEQISFF